MPDHATPQPDPPAPGSVTLPVWAVEKLREYLTAALDDSAAPDERNEARIALVGYLDAVLEL